MDESTFQKELVKYKTIRPPDYYKPKVTATTSTPKASTNPKQITTTTQTAPVPSIPVSESNFYELFSAANSSILTSSESIKFIEHLKKVCNFSLKFFI